MHNKEISLHIRIVDIKKWLTVLAWALVFSLQMYYNIGGGCGGVVRTSDWHTGYPGSPRSAQVQNRPAHHPNHLQGHNR